MSQIFYTRESKPEPHKPLLVYRPDQTDSATCVSGKMADRDNNVYLAKLAEQAERYDGECSLYLCQKALSL